MSIAYPLIRLSISHTSHVATGKSTRPRGARLRRTICDFWSRNFNPRARVGRDVFRQWRYWSALLFQSTCPRGARHEIAGRSLNKTVFQSTRPRGARLSMNRFQYLVLRFQSTRPRGARHRKWRSRVRLPCFNPRARVGRDCLLTGQIPTIRQSNLTSKPQQS